MLVLLLLLLYFSMNYSTESMRRWTQDVVTTSDVYITEISQSSFAPGHLSRLAHVPLVPMVLSPVVEETARVQRFQLIQTGPTMLVNRLRAYLSALGITEVTLEHASERPALHPISGKFCHVWAELPRRLEAQQQARVPSLSHQNSGTPPEEEPYQEEGIDEASSAIHTPS